ncbi:unnamed protein product [Symbiodinium natans]|uniref:C3H1-type domain-containing protein n=1 Tax=Symbiodinium natans TaxID=878477 RepID=A0A812MB74_9DINO|nr:unnamed protein product [Symbiodinium natans]
MSNPLLAALVQAAVSGPASGAGKGTGRGVCFSFRNTGMCQHGDNCRYEHVQQVGSQRRDSGFTLTGPDASKKSASQALQVQPNLHDFFGFSKGAAPCDNGEQYGKITVVDRDHIISQLVAVEDGQLTHRVMAVPAAVHSEVHELLEFFGTGVSIGGRAVTTQDMQQQLKAFADHLRTSGWRPRVAAPSTSLQSDLASNISELTALLKNGLNTPTSSSAKRVHEASPGDIIAAMGNLSPENRAAVLVALGGGSSVPPGPSPPRKAAVFGGGAMEARPHVPPLPTVDVSTPLFPDADMEADAPANADLARVENELLALVRSSSSGLPSVRDKAAFDESAPLNVAALDGMIGPCQLDADASSLPDLATLVGSQTDELIATCREIIPKVVRQLNLVFKPQRFEFYQGDSDRRIPGLVVSDFFGLLVMRGVCIMALFYHCVDA